MSQGDDFSSTVDYDTMRGQDYPAIRQFTVFLENRVGVLTSLVRRFAGTKVRFLSLSIIDSTECSFVRIVFSHPEQGREILERAGLAMVESDLLAVELNDVQQPLLQLFSALLQAEVNLVQTCNLMVPNYEGNVLGIMVDNIDLAQEILAANGFNLLTEDDLQEIIESSEGE